MAKIRETSDKPRPTNSSFRAFRATSCASWKSKIVFLQAVSNRKFAQKTINDKQCDEKMVWIQVMKKEGVRFEKEKIKYSKNQWVSEKWVSEKVILKEKWKMREQKKNE